MAAKNKTVAVATREAVAEDVVNVTTADASGRMIAEYLVGGLKDGRERIFTLARYTHGALIMGGKPAEVSKAIATHAARLIDDENERAFALANSVTKGGVAMTGNAVKQYSAAWASILSGAMTPTTATVVVAFRAFTSAGAKGLAEAHTKLLNTVAGLPEGDRDAYYIAHAPIVAKAVKDASKESKSENAATASADEKSEDKSETVELDNIEEIRAYIEATVSRPWSDDDKASLAAIFTAAAEALA